MQTSTLRARPRPLLTKAALVEIALGQEQELFNEVPYPSSFDENAIKGLRRHGPPWTWMLKIGFEQGMRPANSDFYWTEVKNLGRDKLRGAISSPFWASKRCAEGLAEYREVSQLRFDHRFFTPVFLHLYTFLYNPYLWPVCLPATKNVVGFDRGVLKAAKYHQHSG